MEALVARVPTDQAARYMTQLAKHWSHRFQVELGEAAARIALPLGVARLTAGPEALGVTLEVAPQADPAWFKEVVESHLNRFAFREGELAYDWTEA